MSPSPIPPGTELLSNKEFGTLVETGSTSTGPGKVNLAVSNLFCYIGRAERRNELPKDGFKAWCPHKDGTCCSSSSHCCPKGLKCVESDSCSTPKCVPDSGNPVAKDEPPQRRNPPRRSAPMGPPSEGPEGSPQEQLKAKAPPKPDTDEEGGDNDASDGNKLGNNGATSTYPSIFFFFFFFSYFCSCACTCVDLSRSSDPFFLLFLYCFPLPPPLCYYFSHLELQQGSPSQGTQEVTLLASS